MSDGWNDYNIVAQGKGADVSSSYDSSVDKDDQDEDEQDISQSENSFRQEAVLPESDHLNVSGLPEFGYTKIYKVEQGLNENAGTKMAIPKVSLYLETSKCDCGYS
jgi:hypothetical protein